MKHAIVGVPIPAEVRSTLEKAQGGLHTGQLVAGENMHVAIADFGEQPDWMIENLKKSLIQVEVGPFYISIEGVATEGGQQPTAVYAEIEDPKQLKKLHRQVTRVARVDGVEIPHQQWSPGVTLAGSRRFLLSRTRLSECPPQHLAKTGFCSRSCHQTCRHDRILTIVRVRGTRGNV